MNPAHKDLFEALAEAAEPGGCLSPEWEQRLEREPELRELATRFEQIGGVLRGLAPVSAPSELEGRVVGAMQAGHREDRAVSTLRGLSEQRAPLELEALVAESMPGATQLDAPPELDRRVEALLKGWEGEEEGSEPIERPRRSRLVLVGQVAAAASGLFLVVLATPRKSEHERARDQLTQAVVVSKGEGSLQSNASLGESVVSELLGGRVELAAPRRHANKMPSAPNPANAGRGSQRQNAATSARGVGAQGGSQSSTASGAGAAGRSGADLLTMLSDPTVPSHQGERVVRLSVGSSSPIILIYREQVAVTPDGHFSVDVTEVLQPQMAPATEETFESLQKSRESFTHRYRGFMIRDVARFTEQYTTVQSFNSEIISGRECVELEVEPNLEGAHSYHLWIDPEFGVCLKTQEFNGEGHLVCEVEYESIEYAPELVSELSGGPSAWEAVEGGAAASQVLRPLWIPESYALQGVEAFTDMTGGEWTRLRYTDGVDMLMVLQGGEQATARAPSTGPAKSALTQVFLHKVGAWTMVEGPAAGHHFIVMGKRPEADLVATFASVVP